MNIFFKLIILSLLVWISIDAISSCNSGAAKPAREVDRSFYYWQSVFKLSNFEKKQLKELNVNTIYLKFFDVDWNDNTKNAMPLAQLRIADPQFLKGKNIIPAIFITNECIFKIDSTQTDSLGIKMIRLVKEMAAVNGLDKIKEIQIDCDWTSATKNKYFALLRTIRQQDTTMNISATIRLHQIKYLSQTGVPPVTKGMLMCYNMGNLKIPATKNSIIETEELKKFIAKLNEYPLPLDVALPIFDWNVLIRNNAFAGLMEELPAEILNSSLFLKKSNRYEVTADTAFAGYEFKKGDIIRNEKSDYEVVMQCAKLLSDRMTVRRLNVSLYHLDSLTLSKYSLHELENIYNSMR